MPLDSDNSDIQKTQTSMDLWKTRKTKCIIVIRTDRIMKDRSTSLTNRILESGDGVEVKLRRHGSN